jgi:signal transduction histidine kinase/ActR/RegA family two-component response regulator
MNAEQALGDGWTGALHPEDRERIVAGWEQAVRAGQSSAAEFRFVRPDGTETWLVGQSRAQVQPDGRLAGYVGTITDVTSLKRAEDERKRTEAALRQARKMESLGTLAGGIAHDFNNILTGTLGFIDLARLELPVDHAANAWLDRVVASSVRARELVRQILTFSRKNEGPRVPQRLHVVVGEALRLLRSTLPPMVELEPRIDAHAPPALADANQIHQVVINLCTNAWHALPPRGGRVTVTLEGCTVSPEQTATHPELRPGAWLRLSVADNGCGMDAATLEHIFEPFFTTKETGRGTGLGLPVVHGIVKSHEGVILVRSVVGEGSTFDVYLPASRADVEPPVAPVTEIPRGAGEHVLVVDDDAVSGFAIEKMIESLGYTVSRCTRPEDALAQFASEPARYDLVVSDLAMPGMNGAELIEHLVRIRPEVRVVVVTGYVESERQRLLERSAARAVLRKPVNRDELARIVAEHVAKDRIRER